jgi:lycopene cyclase domain-containing protein
MSIAYLAFLLVAIGCMVLVDRRFRLFFFRDARRAAVALGLGLAFFLTWDVIGIQRGIFFRGETSFMTGIEIVKNLPLEEPFFLGFLCYLIMVLTMGGARLHARFGRSQWRDRPPHEIRNRQAQLPGRHVRSRR